MVVEPASEMIFLATKTQKHKVSPNLLLGLDFKPWCNLVSWSLGGNFYFIFLNFVLTTIDNNRQH